MPGAACPPATGAFVVLPGVEAAAAVPLLGEENPSSPAATPRPASGEALAGGNLLLYPALSSSSAGVSLVGCLGPYFSVMATVISRSEGNRLPGAVSITAGMLRGRGASGTKGVLAGAADFTGAAAAAATLEATVCALSAAAFSADSLASAHSSSGVRWFAPLGPYFSVMATVISRSEGSSSPGAVSITGGMFSTRGNGGASGVGPGWGTARDLAAGVLSAGAVTGTAAAPSAGTSPPFSASSWASLASFSFLSFASAHSSSGVR
ncbi:hypothetical protein AGDE_14373 [Angomonas deanei]|nr:hypothetical protein AGDE_14373 [Angomonas deanei]|eukprot:EPY20954.1 hypothetical protein AGDE_14373 [Angomonas deanei]